MEIMAWSQCPRGHSLILTDRVERRRKALPGESQCPRGHSLILTPTYRHYEQRQIYVSMPSRAFFDSHHVTGEIGNLMCGVSMPSRAFFDSHATGQGITTDKLSERSQCPRGHSLILTGGAGMILTPTCYYVAMPSRAFFDSHPCSGIVIFAPFCSSFLGWAIPTPPHW